VIISKLLWIGLLLSSWALAADNAMPPVNSGVPTSKPATAAYPRSSDLHGVLMDAMNPPHSVKKFWLAGVLADKLRAQTQVPPATPVLVTISTLKLYQHGCNRMRIRFAEPSHWMATVDGSEAPFSVYYDLNICRDGRPPQSEPVELKQ
jgi:hypothetical protein